MIISLVAVVVIIALALLGPAVGNIFSKIMDPFEDADIEPGTVTDPPPPECYGSFLMPMMVTLMGVFILISHRPPALRAHPA